MMALCLCSPTLIPPVNGDGPFESAKRLFKRPGTFALAVIKQFRANQGVLLAGAVAYYTLLWGKLVLHNERTSAVKARTVDLQHRETPDREARFGRG
jgi:hypothetical protein